MTERSAQSPMNTDPVLADVAARLHQTPLGQAPIDQVINRLARERKFKGARLFSLTLLEARQHVIRAWWWARLMTAEETREERAQIIVMSKSYRKHVSR